MKAVINVELYDDIYVSDLAEALTGLPPDAVVKSLSKVNKTWFLTVHANGGFQESLHGYYNRSER